MRWRTEAEQEIPEPSAVFHRARSKRFLNLLRGLGASPRPRRVIPPGLPLVFATQPKQPRVPRGLGDRQRISGPRAVNSKPSFKRVSRKQSSSPP